MHVIKNVQSRIRFSLILPLAPVKHAVVVLPIG